MKIFQLITDYNGLEDVNAIIAVEENLSGIGMYDLQKGNDYSNWKSTIKLCYDPKEGEKWTDFLSNELGWHVVNDKVKNILTTSNINGIQFLPVQVRNIVTNETAHYFVLNFSILHRVLFDFKSTEYIGPRPTTDRIYLTAAKYYGLKKEKIEGMDLFKMKEINVPTFISERLKKLFLQEGVFGVDYKKTNLG